MTIDYDALDVIRPLMGDGVPSKTALPAVWWLTVDPKQIAAYDRWRADYDDHIKKVDAFAKALGLRGKEDAYMWSHGTASVITGFAPTNEMTLWSGHERHQPVPVGWRIDRKGETKLVPSRKTKADREGQVVKDFAALKKVPNVGSYVSGLPTEISLDDRDWGGTLYYVRFRRGEHCVWAYCGGDPDRQLDKRNNNATDVTVWHRMKLSILAALIEEKAERLLREAS